MYDHLVPEVNKWFGFHVLKEINLTIQLTIQAGEVVVDLGPSGSGKSTLLRCIKQLETVSDGEVIMDGVKMNAPKTKLN